MFHCIYVIMCPGLMTFHCIYVIMCLGLTMFHCIYVIMCLGLTMFHCICVIICPRWSLLVTTNISINPAITYLLSEFIIQESPFDQVPLFLQGVVETGVD